MDTEIPKAYDPKAWEDDLYRKWEESGFFNPDICIEKGITDTDKPTYSIVLPPPNVTGTLHAGHAAMLAIEDTIVRYHRMKGDRTLWLPGTDHAAIATQSKVEKILMKEEGKNRHDLGRDEFLSRVERFAADSHDTIVNQCKKMGSSLDWSREAYTLDEKRSLAVRTAFKKMYDDGLIYRGYRPVNWSVKGQSTCSDDELVSVDRKATLSTFRYSKDFPIAIATTRPETKLGDTAVAVHPDDERYREFVGQTFEIDSFAGGSRLSIKIIADEMVDPAFGTGAVGITPAHSHTDYDFYLRHKDEVAFAPQGVPVIGTDGKITTAAGEAYAGLPVLEAREKVVASLRTSGLLETEAEIDQSVGTSDRYEDVVEVIPMKQWFIDVNKKFDRDGRTVSLKQLMQGSVSSGRVTILPDRFAKTYFHWINNLRDWCISRQIWFGHRIPVWYCLNCKHERINATVKSRWFFMRHGETDHNKNKVNAGSTDIPLNDIGREQAREASKKLSQKNIDVIFSSNLSRACETAEIIGREIGIEEIIIDDRLQERNLGDAEGVSYSETKERFPDLYAYDGKPADNESYHEMEERIWGAISEHLENHKHKNVLIVSHGAALRTLIRRVRDIDPADILTIPALPNASPFSFDVLEPCEKCGSHFFEQDPDTLDTWFSSGLWTFSTLGWPTHSQASVAGRPGRENDFANYHPTNLLETGYDILFFWVARMILMTEYLIGTHPFDTVYLHGLVRDGEGRKMSKSLGNTIDPLTVSEEHGADALRMALMSGATPGNDMKLSDDKIVAMRNLTNKLWNIARYISSSCSPAGGELPPMAGEGWEAKSDADHNLIAKLERIVASVTRHLDSYELSLATETLRAFTWDDFADWYVEVHKIEHNDALLRHAFDTILKLWHPFMPFVTEAIHQTIHLDRSEFLMIAKWPAQSASRTVAGGPAIESENRFELVKDLIVGIRNIRSVYHIDPGLKMILSAKGASDRTLHHKDAIRDNEEIIKRLARISEVRSLDFNAAIPQDSIPVQSGLLQAFLHLDGAIDIEKEKARIGKELVETEKYAASLQAKLANPNFADRAPQALVEQTRIALDATRAKAEELQAHLSSLG